MRPPPLTPATLLLRYKRFLADVRFEDGGVATAHVPNSGKMLGVSAPGATVWLSQAKPGRKLGWTLHLVEAVGGLVGVDTSWPNRLVEEAILAGVIAELRGYPTLRREVAYGRQSRVDLLLEGTGPPCFVEVKNVHLSRTGGLAEFPDCVAARSARHLDELSDMVRAGARAVVVFVVQRADCQTFRPAADLDPGFAAAFARAREAGVEMLPYACAMNLGEVRLTHRLLLAI